MLTEETQYNATARRILGAARVLFMQRGYRAVSITDIVQAADVTKPTLYYHFADKEALFVEMSLQVLREMQARFDAAIDAGAPLAAQLVALTETMRSADDMDSRMLRHEIREHVPPARQQQIAEAFLAHMVAPVVAVMARGLARGDLIGRSSHELAWLFFGFAEGFYQHPGTDVQPYQHPIEAMSTAALVDLFLYGVAARTPHT